MSEMLLLGAGASVEAGVPGAYTMTQEILQKFQEDRYFSPQHAHLISFVIGGLMYQQGIRGGSPYDGVNVEELFNAMQLLGERRTLEAAPFIGSWHSMVDEFDKISPRKPNVDRLYKAIYAGIFKEIKAAFSVSPPAFADRDIDTALQNTIKSAVETAVNGRSSSSGSSNSVGKAVGKFLSDTVKKWSSEIANSHPSPSSDMSRELAQAIEQVQAQPGEGKIYGVVNQRMIGMLAGIVWIDRADRVQHLQPLLNLLQTQKRLVVATLNYDNGVELMADSHGISCETGIGNWSKTGTFDLNDVGLHLLKLHGSIDWSIERNRQTAERPMPHSVITRRSAQVVREAGNSPQQRVTYTPAVIFGQRNKLTAEGPYLDMLRAFQRELLQTQTLTVVGYSFRDAHINEFISQWLNQSVDHILRIVDPSFSTDQRQNLTQYAKDLLEHAGGRLRVCQKGAGEALAELYSAKEA